jgi:hypothetical protein
MAVPLIYIAFNVEEISAKIAKTWFYRILLDYHIVGY